VNRALRRLMPQHMLRRWLGVLCVLLVVASTQALLHPFKHLPGAGTAAHALLASDLDEAKLDLPDHVEDRLCFDCVAGQVARVAMPATPWVVTLNTAGPAGWTPPPCTPDGRCPARPRSRSPPLG